MPKLDRDQELDRDLERAWKMFLAQTAEASCERDRQWQKVTEEYYRQWHAIAATFEQASDPARQAFTEASDRARAKWEAAGPATEFRIPVRV